MTIDPGMFAKRAGIRDFAVPAALLGAALTLPPKLFYPMSLSYDTWRLSQPDRNIFDLLGTGLSAAGIYRAFSSDEKNPITPQQYAVSYLGGS